MDYQVSLCETAPQTVLRVPHEMPPERLGEGILNGMLELAAVAQRAGLTASGAPTITFHHELPATDTVVVDFGVPIEAAPNLGPASGGRIAIEPATLVARTCHRGGYDTIDGAYRALGEWMHASGYRPIGPPTEAYLIGPDEVTDPRQLITEVRIPITPAPMLAVHLDTGFAETVARTREALRQHGFETPTEIDVQAVLRARREEHMENYLMLAALHPRLAQLALEVDRQAAILLTCTVIVRSDETGTLVEAADPTVLVGATAQPELRPVAFDLQRLLTAALRDLRNVPSGPARAEGHHADPATETPAARLHGTNTH